MATSDPPVTIGPIAPFFIVGDLMRSVRFYQERLGFELRYIGPEGDPFFAIVGRDQVEIHLKEIGPDVPPLSNPARHENASWDAFVLTPAPDALAAELGARGLQARLEDRDDGLLGFRVRDADGYTLFFGRVKP